MSAGYTARVDYEMCMASGVCVADAPGAFAFDVKGIAVALPGAADLGDDRLLRLARNCPAGAIVLIDEAGNEIDPFA